MGTRRGGRPDVIIVVLDTGRAFDISAVWPDCPSTTPFLEELARSSLVFPEATTPSPWTLPAHASLFTGLLPAAHGATEVSMRLSNGPPTMAELLGAAGYATVAVACNDLVGPEAGLTRGFALAVNEADALPAGLPSGPIERLIRRSGRLRSRVQARHRTVRMMHDHGGARANRLVGRALRTVPADRPMLLFVNYIEPHLPYLPPDDLARRFLPDGVSLESARKVNQRTLDHVLGDVHHDATDWAILRGLYRATLAYTDALIRDLLAEIRRVRGHDDALIVVTSDHGENIGDHGLMDHQCCLNETVLRIPLLVRLPGGELSGSRPGLASLTDILPTVGAVAGIDLPTTEGQPLTQAVTRPYVVAEYLVPTTMLASGRELRPDVDWESKFPELRSLRTRTHKYIWQSIGDDQFYDLEADPYETHNLNGVHPDQPELVGLMRHWEERTRAATTAPDSPEALLERMRALGYVS